MSEYTKANRDLARATDDLRSVDQGKRAASSHTPGQVNDHALNVAKRENWWKTTGSK